MKILKNIAKALLSLALFANLSLAENYKELNSPLQDEEKSLIEVFSFWCGGCFYHHRQSTIDKIKEKVPNLKYKVYPFTEVMFGEEFGRLYAYAQSKDEAANIDYTDENSLMHKLADAYFVSIFERRQNYTDSKSFIELGLKTLNISKNELNNFIKSTKGQEILKEYKKANALTKEIGLTPSFTVNGKYALVLKEIKNFDELIEVISSLSQK